MIELPTQHEHSVCIIDLYAIIYPTQVSQKRYNSIASQDKIRESTNCVECTDVYKIIIIVV